MHVHMDMHAGASACLSVCAQSMQVTIKLPFEGICQASALYSPMNERGSATVKIYLGS